MNQNKDTAIKPIEDKQNKTKKRIPKTQDQNNQSKTRRFKAIRDKQGNKRHTYTNQQIKQSAIRPHKQSGQNKDILNHQKTLPA